MKSAFSSWSQQYNSDQLRPRLNDWTPNGAVPGNGQLRKKDKKKDPIIAFKNKLIESELFDDGDMEEMQGSVIMQLDEAVAFAVNAEKPATDDALAGVYADTHNGLVF